ncbi:MAG: hypothetical protein RMK30_04255 [Anaerolineae bacterium]|nr:hypothetical protein [Anaerolineae bacterium]
MKAVVIKGTREGIVIVLRGGNSEKVLLELEATLSSAGSLLEGNKVVLEIKVPDMGVDELSKAMEILRNHGLFPEKIVSDEERVRKAAYALGLEVEKGREEKTLSLPW